MSTAFETIMREKLKDFSIDNEGQFCGYCETQDEVDVLLTQLKCVGYSYSVRSSRPIQHLKDAGEARSCPKFFFSQSKGNVEIRFFGFPFSLESVSHRECILGPKYYKEKEAAVPDHLADHVNPKKRLRIMDTRKTGCPATFTVKCIRVYPGYVLESERAHSRIKKKVLDSLREDLQSQNEPTSYLQYHVVASPPDSHTHHTESVKVTGEIHTMLANEIINVVKQGTISVPVIKLHLENFVKTNFSAATMPDRNNVMFYPTDTTIYNHIYNAVSKMKQTPIDQDALQMKVNEWQKELTGDNIHFRPRTEVDGEVHPLLFCYQTAWQRELLRKYGTVCLLDATYKTTKYDIPLFFVTVKANVCYLVVGFFYVQVEDTWSISEALKIFKEWNPSMNPLYWVTDFSESEINAIQSVFPCSKVYLCSFHRKMAWKRWLVSHVKEKQKRDTIFSLWVDVADSSTLQQYNDNLAKLRTDDVFDKPHDPALQYFDKQWVPVHQRWVKAFEYKGMFASINTTNGAEAMNKVVKHSHLEHNTDTTLTGVVTVVVNSYLPNLIEKYCKLNSAIKSYSKDIPVFLHRKTPKFVKHVMIRYEKIDLSAESVTMVSTGLFHVKSAETKDCLYKVDFAKPDCSCPDFQKFKYPCKHFCAIFRFFSEWGFDKLNLTYRTSPLICLDETYGFGSRSSTQTNIAAQGLQDTSSNQETNELLNIPETSSSNVTAHQRAREICKNLINLTYNCSTETAEKMTERLEIVQHDAEASNPTDNGLPLAVTSTSKT